MPLEGGLEPAPAGRLRRVGPAITSAASHATWSTLANTGRIAAAHTTPLTPAVFGYTSEKRRIEMKKFAILILAFFYNNSEGMRKSNNWIADFGNLSRKWELSQRGGWI
jgi:hypothetical protein